MSVGTDWPMSWRTASVSLVYVDMTAPWAWVSKYLIGRDCMRSNMSSRMCLREPCVTTAMIREYSRLVSTPRA